MEGNIAQAADRGGAPRSEAREKVTNRSVNCKKITFFSLSILKSFTKVSGLPSI